MGYKTIGDEYISSSTHIPHFKMEKDIIEGNWNILRGVQLISVRVRLQMTVEVGFFIFAGVLLLIILHHFWWEGYFCEMRFGEKPPLKPLTWKEWRRDKCPVLMYWGAAYARKQRMRKLEQTHWMGWTPCQPLKYFNGTLDKKGLFKKFWKFRTNWYTGSHA